MKNSLGDEEIASFLEPYEFVPSSLACERIRVYLSLLLRWNQKISLTAITDTSEILRHHFGESILATTAVPIRNGRLADVGTGAGFPGLPIKIAQPDVSILLIESNVKKCAFLSEVVRALRIDAEVIRGRMETSLSQNSGLSYITSRAVGDWNGILRLGSRLEKNGKIVLWVGKHAISEITVKDRGNWMWREPIAIPGSMKHFLLVGSKL